MAECLNKEELMFSDLLEGEYEGGFKLWEGSIDLCRFLIEESEKSSRNFEA